MDSGNSGSMQSSSGGSEEYDSRAESISGFINNSPSSHVGHRGPLGTQPPQQISHSPSSSAMFDPLGNYLDHPNNLSRSPANPTSLLNLDAVWSKQLRSDPNCTDLGGFMGMASSSSSPFLTNNQQAQSRATLQMAQGQGPESGTKSSSDHQPKNINNNNSSMMNTMQRNPKKRSRASRRAPTTVLTTDTSNFRAMVQEFTGIPAPPFTSSPFPRTRLDLFGTPSSSITMRSTPSLDLSPPHYLLRPFPQKIQVQPPHPHFVSSSSSSSSSMVDAIPSIPHTTDNTNNTTSCTSSTSINYQLSSELGLLKQPHHNLLNINMQQNPILNFQSLLQTPSKYPLPNPSNDSPLKMGILDEFGLSHGHVNVNTNLGGLHNMATSSSDGALPTNETSGNPASWGQGAGSQQHEQADDQGLLRSINGGFNSNSQAQQRASSNGKLLSNFSASSSDFHGDKGPENVAARSEGMVEQWICSSD